MKCPRFLRLGQSSNWMAGLLLAAGAALVFTPGCGKKDDTASSGSSASTPAAGGTASGGLTVGFLYVGAKDDYGYNEAHAAGAAEVKKMPGVSVIEDDSVQEDKDCETAMESMVKLNGAKLIFATSFGYFPHVKAVAPKFPDVTFLHAGGTLKDGDPPNVGSYFAYIDELEYLCGIVSGLTTKTGKLGYIAAKPIPPVLRDINAFELGAKSVNPKATTTVIFTGGWFDPIKEANAVNNLADQQIDVVTGHIDSPKAMILAAKARNIFCCGYHFNGSALAPDQYLTGAEWNWGPMYTKFVSDFQAGKPKPINTMGSILDNSVQLSPYGPAVSQAAKDAVTPVLAAMKAGTFQMYKGPINDNTGKVMLEAGKALSDQDGMIWGLNSTGQLVEGCIGSTK